MNGNSSCFPPPSSSLAVVALRAVGDMPSRSLSYQLLIHVSSANVPAASQTPLIGCFGRSGYPWIGTTSFFCITCGFLYLHLRYQLFCEFGQVLPKFQLTSPALTHSIMELPWCSQPNVTMEIVTPSFILPKGNPTNESSSPRTVMTKRSFNLQSLQLTFGTAFGGGQGVFG